MHLSTPCAQDNQRTNIACASRPSLCAAERQGHRRGPRHRAGERGTPPLQRKARVERRRVPIVEPGKQEELAVHQVRPLAPEEDYHDNILLINSSVFLFVQNI